MADFLPSSALPISLFPPHPDHETIPHLLDSPPTPNPPSGPLAEPRGKPNPELEKHESRRNAFGLYKVYRCPASDLPHDPDSVTTPSDLREIEPLPVENTLEERPSHLFHPFPNASSFALGEWFWSDDHEKSQKSFKALLDVVGNQGFKPSDVRETNWTAINQALGATEHELDKLGPEWIDDGITWRSQPVTIAVPFNTTSKSPGTHAFTIPEFHYRPLVPLIKQKLEDSRTQEFFHTLGHELRWCPREGGEDVRVYGEMYNSPAFIEAQEKLLVSHVHEFLFCFAKKFDRIGKSS